MIRFLHEVGRDDTGNLGGKGRGLVGLMAAGLPVPPGFVLTREAFRAHCAQHQLEPVLEALELSARAGDEAELERLSRDARAAILSGALPSELAAQLDRARQRLQGMEGAGPLAVRSSALDEDGAQASAAGQYESHLNVFGQEGLLDAVRSVWASYCLPRALRYRARQQPGREGMAVVVQRLVQPRVAGTLFTVNPLSGDRAELALEAGPGLAEALVSGQMEADRWIVQRDRSLAGLRQRLHIRSAHVAEQPFRLVAEPLGSGRLSRVPLSPDERATPSLSPDEVLEVCRLGLTAERALGGAQDIEWALDPAGRVWLLQARAITTLEEKERPGALWTMRFSGERWTEPVTPLGWSLIGPLLGWFIEWPLAQRLFLDGSANTALYEGVPYFNLAIFRSLLFRLPGMGAPGFAVELFPPEEQQRLREETVYWPHFGVVAAILWQVAREQRWRRYSFNPLTNWREWAALEPELLAATQALRTSPATAREGLTEARRALQLMRRYVRVHLLSLAFANIGFQLVVAALRPQLGEEAQRIASDLTLHPAHNRTLAANKELWKLAGLAQSSPELRRLIEAPDGAPGSASWRAAVQQTSGGARFLAAFQAFLDSYGQRSSATWEIFAPRWSDTPTLPLGLVRSYLTQGIHTDPYVLEERQQAARENAERQVRARVPMRRRIWFGRLLDLTRRYTVLRENQRFAFDHLTRATKQLYFGIGRCLVEQGLLERADDVAFLTEAELCGLVHRSLPSSGLLSAVQRRRQERSRQQEVLHPAFLDAAQQPLYVAEPGRRYLSGLGISPGRIRGRVRIIRDLSEASRLQRGEILVTRATDPGWTPLFLTAAGLIMELGSMLSHGAVVAREYGLPAVANISGATSLLADGQEVVVDGSLGRVHLSLHRR